MFLIDLDQDELRNAKLASEQNMFKVKSPLQFTISLQYNETLRRISCDTEKKEWMNPCDILTPPSGSVC